jgi:hypothetical protein
MSQLVEKVGMLYGMPDPAYDVMQREDIMEIFKKLKQYVVLNTKSFKPKIMTNVEMSNWIPNESTGREEAELAFYDLFSQMGLQVNDATIHTSYWRDVPTEVLVKDVEAVYHTIKRSKINRIEHHKSMITELEAVKAKPYVESRNNSEFSGTTNVINRLPPKTFSGKTGNVSVLAETFIHEVERFAQETGELPMSIVPTYVTSYAKNVLNKIVDEHEHREEFLHWKSFKQLWKKEFCGKNILSDIRKYYLATRHPNEKCYMFISRIRRYGAKAEIPDLNESESIKSWIERLPEFVMTRALQQLHTFNDLMDLMEYLENNTASFDKYVQPKVAALGIEENGEEDPVALAFKPHCDHKNHEADNCYKQNLCNKCNKYGHLSSNCYANCKLCDKLHGEENCPVIDWLENNRNNLPEGFPIKDFRLAY